MGHVRHYERRCTLWNEFYCTVAVAVLLLYVPGYLFWRGLRFSPTIALCCAPLYSVFAYSVLPIAAYELGVSCNVTTILGPTLAVALAIYAIARWRQTEESARLALVSQDPIHIGPLKVPFDLVAILAYVAIASVVTYLVFVRNLPHPDAFYSRFDNQTHINAVQAFVESGKWSTLHESAFLASPLNATPAGNNTGGFYPSAWHDLNALVYLAAHANVTITANAVVTALCAITLPLGTFLLLRALFPESRGVILCGSLATSMFSTWPWVFIVKGPCYPNLLGMTLMAAALGVIIAYVDGGLVLKKLPSFVALCAVSFVSLALSHPNTLFTAYVFMSAYGAHVIYRVITDSNRLHGVARILVLLLSLGLYFAAIVAFWYACYQIPAFSGILGYHWTENTNVLKAIISLLSFRLIVGGTQVTVAFMVLVGVLACLRDRDYWLLWAPAFFSVCFLACRCGWEPLKYWLAALWYMTPYRFSANISLFCIPLAALGLDTTLRLALSGREALHEEVPTATGSHLRTNRNVGTTRPLRAALALAAIVAVTFMPSIPLPIGDGSSIETSFSRIHHHIERIYSDNVEHVYSVKEVAFVEKVKDAIPEGALVLNFPNDGSMWAYGVNELNTFYRNRSTGGQTEESKLIREHLNEYPTNKQVQEAVKSTGAQYLLVLDKGVSYEDGVWIPQYKETQVKAWKGINAVDDDNPGFEIVLSEDDDMRLYRIVDVSELEPAA